MTEMRSQHAMETNIAYSIQLFSCIDKEVSQGAVLATGAIIVHTETSSGSNITASAVRGDGRSLRFHLCGLVVRSDMLVVFCCIVNSV